MLGERLCRTPESFKAWSQNLGHDGVLTTLYSYGQVDSARQANIMREMPGPNASVDPNPSHFRDYLCELIQAELSRQTANMPNTS